MVKKDVVYTEKMLKQMSFFDVLTEGETKVLQQKVSKSLYTSKDIIFRQNTRTAHIMYIRSGFVKIFKESPPDITVLLKFVPSHQFLGLSTFFGDTHYQYSAAAVDDTEIIFIEADYFNELLQTNHQFNLKIINQISQESLYIFDKLMRHAYKHLPGRVADVILYFSEQIYKSEDFTFPISRKELADFAGSTPESFIRTLTEFKNDRIIELDGAHVVIKSMELIKTLSENG